MANGRVFRLAVQTQVVRSFMPLAAAMLVIVVCAVSYGGFYQKWRLRDETPRFSVVEILEGTAHRPFVYRRLLPEIANVAARITPARAQGFATHAFANRLSPSRASTDPRYAFRYVVLYMLGYLCLVAAAGLLIAGTAGEFSTSAALIATCTFVLFFPVLQSVGGYVYDFSELLFLSAAFLAARGGPSWLLIPLAAIGTYNKESFFFFIPTLLPYLLARHRPHVALAWLAAACSTALGAYALTWWRFAANPGGTVELHFLQNLHWYANPRNLFHREITYGLPLLAGYSIATLGLAVFLIAWGWSGVRAADRRHILIACAINAPLMLVFCWPGETRNLSLTYPGFILLGAVAFRRLLAAGREAARPWTGGFAEARERRRA